MERQNKAYAYAIAVVCLWATVASAFKLTLQRLSVIQMLLYSSAVSLLVLFIIMTAQGKLKLLGTYSKKDYAYAAGLGFLNPFAYYLILFGAYSLLPAQEAQPLNQTWAVLIPLLSIIILGQKIGTGNIMALLVSFFGVFVISTQGNILGLGFANPLGVSLALFSAVIWAVFWIGNMRDRHDEVVKLFLNFAFGSLFVLAAAFYLSALSPPGEEGLAGAVYIGLFEMGISFFFWMSALKLSKTTAQVSNLIYIIPFMSLVLINFVLNEPVKLPTVAGLAFIVAGILLQQHFSRKKLTGLKEIPAPAEPPAPAKLGKKP